MNNGKIVGWGEEAIRFSVSTLFGDCFVVPPRNDGGLGVWFWLVKLVGYKHSCIVCYGLKTLIKLVRHCDEHGRLVM